MAAIVANDSGLFLFKFNEYEFSFSDIKSFIFLVNHNHRDNDQIICISTITKFIIQTIFRNKLIELVKYEFEIID
ncbi:hypothetical protein LFREDSHE_24920 [Shewanella baltica]